VQSVLNVQRSEVLESKNGSPIFGLLGQGEYLRGSVDR
jgi:hypothetical protein